MNTTKVSALLLGSCISCYALLRFSYHLRNKQNFKASIKGPDSLLTQILPTSEPIAGRVIERPIARALFAYDTSDHQTLMHTRFDRQTVDTLNKFKLATGVDMSKFVAFSVRHLLNTYPEFKNIINQYLQRTQL
jgi:hypothetical protein